RLRMGDRRPANQRRGSRRLEAEHPRASAEFLEAAPVGGDVAGVADRDAERIQLALQRLDDLERSRLLALDAELVDRVDQRDGLRTGELAHQRQRLVEVA